MKGPCIAFHIPILMPISAVAAAADDVAGTQVEV